LSMIRPGSERNTGQESRGEEVFLSSERKPVEGKKWERKIGIRGAENKVLKTGSTRGPNFIRKARIAKVKKEKLGIPLLGGQWAKMPGVWRSRGGGVKKRYGIAMGRVPSGKGGRRNKLLPTVREKKKEPAEKAFSKRKKQPGSKERCPEGGTGIGLVDHKTGSHPGKMNPENSEAVQILAA